MGAFTIINAAVNGVAIGMLLALPALGITLVYGIARFPNVAAGDYMTLGGYCAIASQLFFGNSIFLAVTLACVATGAVSLFFYLWVFRPLERRSNLAPLIASIGVAFVVRSTITFFAGQGQYEIHVPLVRAWNFQGVRLAPVDFYTMVISAVALVFVFYVLHRTALGRRMRAVADNAHLASASGIRSRQVMIFLWVISGVLCGLGGVLLGIRAVVVPELGFELLMPMFAAVILGGIGHPIGAVVGMLIFGVTQEIASLYVGPAYKIPMAFLVLLMVLLFRPQGIFGRPMAVR